MLDLTKTPGYLVVDCAGRRVGAVECPMYSRSPEIPDAISVRAGFLNRHRRLVTADTIEVIDPLSRVIGLRVGRQAVRAFH